MSDIETQSDEFALRLSGNGITLDRKVSQQIAAEIMSLVLGGRISTSAQPAAPAAPGVAPLDVQISLREYLDEVQAMKKPDQITAIGHYISVHEERSTFTKDDVKERFARAKEPMPGNFPRDFNLAVRAGMIAPAHQQPEHFYVTKTGMQAVERKFAAEQGERRRTATASRKGNASGAKRSTTTQGDDLAIGVNQEKGSARGKRRTSVSVRGSLARLVEQGWFNDERTLAQVVVRLQELAIMAKQTSLSGPIAEMVRDGMLQRKKVNEGAKEVWGYRAT